MMIKWDGNIAIYRGIRFYECSRKGYFRNTNVKPILSLHRYVWECERGQIPDGHDIHHKDGDKRNNHPSNLECIPHKTHCELHSPGRTFRKKHQLICESCSGEYSSAMHWSKFCSVACRNAVHNARLKRRAA